MLIYKQWKRGAGNTFCHYQGWFLFGVIPLMLWKYE